MFAIFVERCAVKFLCRPTFHTEVHFPHVYPERKYGKTSFVQPSFTRRPQLNDVFLRSRQRLDYVFWTFFIRLPLLYRVFSRSPERRIKEAPLSRHDKNAIKDIPALPTSKVIEKFKTRVKNLKIEKIIAFDKNLHELLFTIYFYLSKNLFLTLKNNAVPDLTHFSKKCGCF